VLHAWAPHTSARLVAGQQAEEVVRCRFRRKRPFTVFLLCLEPVAGHQDETARGTNLLSRPTEQSVPHFG
jgi:hypothetical protein